MGRVHRVRRAGSSVIRRIGAILAVAAAAALLAPGAGASVKPSFWGLNLAFYESVPRGDRTRLENAGLRTMRVTLNWYAIQPSRLQTDWSKPDALFTRLAKLGIQPQPLIFGSPFWANGATSLTGQPLDGQTHAMPPVGTASARAAWQSFVQAAVNRYKPGGTFWTAFEQANPGVKPRPIRRWQIWNEPNIPEFFQPKPSVREYARLVRIADRAVDAADPTAKVALAGMLVNARFPETRFLRKLYARPGMSDSFDMVAVHPYGGTVQAVRREVDAVRRTMRQAHDGATPIWVSETSWSSGRNASRIDKGLRGQARELRRTFRMYVHNHRRWRLAEVSWFDLHDPNPDPGTGCDWCRHAGLINYHGRPKPAWRAFRSFLNEAR